MGHFWDFAPSVVVGVIAWTTGYLLAAGPLRRRYQWGAPIPFTRQLCFHLGSLVLLLALVGPLDTLGDSLLFSAHMAQHVLITFIVPPLWLLGTPGWLLRKAIPGQILKPMTSPIIAFSVFNLVMWGWHIPTIYDAALGNEGLHIVEHLTFIGSAITGWLPVMLPEADGGLRPLYRLAYLVPSMFSCTAIAALITLSPAQLYPFYGGSLLPFVMTALQDQQAGGLLMWLVGDMIYLFLIVWTFDRLFNQVSLPEGQV